MEQNVYFSSIFYFKKKKNYLQWHQKLILHSRNDKYHFLPIKKNDKSKNQISKMKMKKIKLNRVMSNRYTSKPSADIFKKLVLSRLLSITLIGAKSSLLTEGGLSCTC